MAQCLTVGGDGVVSSSSANPCTTLVAMTPVEYAALATNPFVLTPEDGGLISFAVIAVWAVAWGFRVLASAVGKVWDRPEE